jgi:Uma2 family endonuclease
MESATLYASSKSRWTDDELMALPRDGHKRELLDGGLLVSPVAVTHSLVCIRLAVALAEFVRRRKLGEVFDSSIGCRLSPDVLLSPDVSFVSKANMRKLFVAPDKFLAGAPDLVVEVLSPSDRLRLVERKLDRYFESGTLIAWLVDCKKQQVRIYAPDKVQTLRRPQDVLTGGEVLPGFKCKLSRIFHA